ncbi:Rv1733c family protein [Streptomyces sp. JNUCC 63]
MRTRVRGRRHNPLRRRSDVVETWTAVLFAVLLFLGAPLLGAFTARWAHDETRAAQTAQRADRHRVHAEVVGRPPQRPPAVPNGGRHTCPVTVRWTEPGRAPRTDVALVPTGTRRGDTVPVWVDSRGHAVSAPPDETTVWQHTVALGACAAAVAATAVLLTRFVVRRVCLRRRMEEWGREWARTGPQWTRGRA